MFIYPPVARTLPLLIIVVIIVHPSSKKRGEEAMTTIEKGMVGHKRIHSVHKQCVTA
jgi:hypothetical protein